MAGNNRLIRLLNMVLIIQTHPGLSAQELARQCGVSQRHLYRDLQVLGEAGVPVYNDQGYKIVERFKLQNISLSLEEALALLYGVKMVKRQKGIFNTVSSVRSKLLDILPFNLRLAVTELEQHVEIADYTAVDYSASDNTFKIINQGIREFKKVEIDYYSFTRDEQNVRKVAPYHLIFKDSFWYLVGFCNWREEERLFRVDRIRNIRLLNENFVISSVKSISSQVCSAWGMELGEEFEFKVRFWNDSARFVRETRFHQSQRIEEEPKGTVLFTSKACGLRPIARWVLSFAGEAEVLEPVELRKMVAEGLAEGLKKYQ